MSETTEWQHECKSERSGENEHTCIQRSLKADGCLAFLALPPALFGVALNTAGLRDARAHTD